MRKVGFPTNIEKSAREQLLISAGELMAERSSSDISLNEIAQRSGLNSALVKYYFGNKSGLLIELLRKIIVPINQQLNELLSMPLSPPEKMRIHISGFVNTYYKYPFINRLMHDMLDENPELFGPIIAEEFSKPVAGAQRRIIEDGVREGYFRPVDPMLFFFHVAGACDQLFFGRFQLEYVFGFKEIDENMKRAFINHLSGTIFDGILINPGNVRSSHKPNENDAHQAAP